MREWHCEALLLILRPATGQDGLEPSQVRCFAAEARLDGNLLAPFRLECVDLFKSRKMRIFSRDSYLSLDYIAKTGMRMGFKEGFDRSKIDIREMAKLEEDQGSYPLFTKYFSIEQLHVASDEPLKSELQSFLHAVRADRTPVVTGAHGLQAIEIATRIQEKIRQQQEKLGRL